jgi:hypothetical protein
VLVLSQWQWSLLPTRRQALEQFVERGGRLVVDDTVLVDGAFKNWSGISHRETDDDLDGTRMRLECRPLEADAADGPEEYSFCAINDGSSLTTRQQALLTMADLDGLQVVRVPIGRGTVTAINAQIYTSRLLLDGDHAAVFARMAGLREGDTVHFMTETDYPSLVTLIWRYGAPVVVFGLALIGVWLWRSSAPFGPAIPVPPPARRALAEQILSTGDFASRHGGLALKAAAMRALEEAVARRRPGIASRTPEGRRAAVEEMTRLDTEIFAESVYHTRAALANAIRRIEQARRSLTTRAHHT